MKKYIEKQNSLNGMKHMLQFISKKIKIKQPLNQKKMNSASKNEHQLVRLKRKIRILSLFEKKNIDHLTKQINSKSGANEKTGLSIIHLMEKIMLS